MKKVVLFFLPLIIAVIIFFSILFLLDRQSGKGALQITSKPISKVYLNNKFIGVTPLCGVCENPTIVPVGDYTLKLVPVNSDLKSYEAKITINKLTLTAFDRTFSTSEESDGSVISLVPIDDKKDAQVLVLSLPENSNVFLDSNPVGKTPLFLKDVSESSHDLRITREGYKEKNVKIKTALGFKLTSLILLGINQDLSISSVSAATLAASSSAKIETPKVLILDTPTGFLRVRKDASILSSEIGKVNPGETYNLIGEKEEWFEIKLNEGKTGWISAVYSKKQ